ncbi:hypothetical protein FS837_001695 [Tulasnella sp. UAMH 9824]|nr:hypothetical protein FS837_001695 [Tulasnella sp. UAMH 9824]
MFGPSPLLPNVKTISWRFVQNSNCTSIVPFVGPKLENLVLEMDGSIESLEQSLLLQSLAHRMPALKFLRLTSSSFAHNMSTSFTALISTSPQLTHIELPPFCLTQEVVAATARLPLLTILTHSKWTKAAETYHESGMRFEFTPAAFPKLEVISFASLPNRMAEVFQSTDHVGRLREVFLDCPAYNSPQEIKNIFAALGSSAKLLDGLQLVCCPIPQLAELEPPMDSLSINTIRPLFSCTRLGLFHLLAPHMVPLKDEDVVEMGKCWPEMGSLILCPAPLVNRDRGVDFGILQTFAASFPNLGQLQLYFGKDIPEFGGNLHPANQFEDLDILGVGFSTVPRRKAQDIGFLLASLCSSPPLIEWGPPRYHRGDDIPEEQRAESEAGWEDVKLAMDLAFRIKKFERS